MLPVYTIATTPEGIASQFNLRSNPVCEPFYQAHPGNTLPIIMQGKEYPINEEAKWQIPVSKNSKRTIPFVSMDNILKRKPYNIMLRKQRCVIPANCFFGIKDGETYLMKLLKERLFGMGGIYTLSYENGEPQYNFAILTTEAPPILKPYLSQIPVVFEPDNHEQWLSTDRLNKVMRYADRATKNWFDIFKVSKMIMYEDENRKELLNPLSTSLSQMMADQNRTKASELEKMRGTRGK